VTNEEKVLAEELGGEVDCCLESGNADGNIKKVTVCLKTLTIVWDLVECEGELTSFPY